MKDGMFWLAVTVIGVVFVVSMIATVNEAAHETLTVIENSLRVAKGE